MSRRTNPGLSDPSAASRLGSAMNLMQNLQSEIRKIVREELAFILGRIRLIEVPPGSRRQPARFNHPPNTPEGQAERRAHERERKRLSRVRVQK